MKMNARPSARHTPTGAGAARAGNRAARTGRRAAGKIDAGMLLFVLCMVFVTFIAGAMAVVLDTAPGKLIRDAHKAGQALYARTFYYTDPFATDLWNRSRSDARGVTVREPEAAEGLTLYTSGEPSEALLIDLDGTRVHRWHRPYSSVWERDSAVRNPVPDDHVYFRKAHMLDDGDLLALYEGVGDTPYGYGLVRLTPGSEVRWKNLDNFHHDFDLTPDGRVVALTHAFRTTELEHADQFDPPLLEDSLVFLDPQGRTLSKLSLLEALNDSDYRSLLWRIPYYSMEDPLHANAVDYLDRQRAAWLRSRIPAAREGQVLVSFRELAGGSIALVDPEAARVVWASRGPWLAQHDPDVLPGGTLQVFDNRGNLGHASRSRVVEVDPATMGLVWVYAGDADNPLDSPIRASQERLPNGNTLITESSGGRLLEVTREGRMVWEYYHPVRGGEQDELIPVVSWAQRIPPDSIPAVFLPRLAAQ